MSSSCAAALREIGECLIQLAGAERLARMAAIREGRGIPVIVGNAENVGDADSDGPIVQFMLDPEDAAKLRREALDEIERIVDRALILAVTS